MVWRRYWKRGLVALPLLFVAFDLVAAFSSPAMEPIRLSAQPLQIDSLTLLGYRQQQTGPDFLTVYPYWQVTAPAPADLQLHWRIQDDAGSIVSDFRSLPYYNTVRAANWPVGTVIDDAARIPLPPGMDAGNYTLSLQLEDGSGNALSDAVDFGEFSLERAVPTLSPPTYAADATMGDAATLDGYDVSVRHGPTRTTQDGLIALNAGAYLDYTLYWQGFSPVAENYHAFVHLVDHNGQPIAQEDHLPGPLFQPPRLWNESHHQPDVYLLRIPDETVGGLYQPLVGMYEYDTQDRLPIFVPGEDAARDDARLAPVKIVQTAPPRPGHKATAHFGDLATLIGYDLTVPDEGLRAGDSFELTLHFRADSTTPVDYTRFVQAHNPALGMAAQYDSLPQDGGNPTWSWLENEIIVDRVQMQVADDAQAGTYPIYIGFYDRAQDGARLPVTDEDGTQTPESWYPVAEITVMP